MPTANPQDERPTPQLEHLEHEESRLWRIVLLFLGLLITAVLAASWGNLGSLPWTLKLLPAGAAAAVVAVALYAAHRRRELAELRGMLRGMQHAQSMPASAEQLAALVETISRSQRGVREMIDNLDDLVFSLSLEGRLLTANKRVAELLDRPFTQIIGHSLDDFLLEPNRTIAEKGLAAFLARRHWSGLLHLRLTSGRLLYLDCTLTPVLTDGEITAISGQARDITQERERETRFTALFETLQEAVYFSTPEGKLLDANPALVRLLGYDSKEELLTVNANDLYLDPARRKALLRELDQRASIREQEIVLRRKDGAPVICLDTAMAIWDTSGKIVRYQGTLLDITARREMEQRLQKEQEFRRRLVESFPDVIVALDTAGNYTYTSARVKEVLGYPPEFFVGRQFGEVIAPDDMPEMKRLFGALTTGEQRLVTYEYSARHQDGTTRLLRASASPMYDANGAIAGVIASVRDITEQTRMQRQFVQSERMAAMGQMVDGFAHELNNPLTAILAACEMLRARNSHGLPAKELDLLHQQAKRAAEVVQNLLFFSRPPAPGTARLDLNELVQRTLKLQTYSLKVNHISVDFLPQPDVPAVTGDPNQLMQVFLNLIINAEQAIRHARERGTLRVRVGRDHSSAWVSFQDDGPGLTPEAAQRVFDPFFSTKRPGGGQGLGLSICRTILQQHGGDIEAAPAPGGGAVFTVRIPLAGALEPDRAATKIAS